MIGCLVLLSGCGLVLLGIFKTSFSPGSSRAVILIGVCYIAISAAVPWDEDE